MAATYRTLKQLRDDLAVRLGFAAQHSQVNAALLNSFLRSANQQLWIQSSWLHGRKDYEGTLTAGAQFLAYPAGLEPGFITSIAAKISGQWVPLDNGIDPEHRLSITSASYPTRYAENANDAGTVKLEFWPLTSQNVDIRIEFDASGGAFTSDTDRPSVPDELVFLHALVNAKLHYRQPDGQGYASQLETMLSAYKARNFGRRVFSPATREVDPYSIPPG